MCVVVRFKKTIRVLEWAIDCLFQVCFLCALTMPSRRRLHHGFCGIGWCMCHSRLSRISQGQTGSCAGSHSRLSPRHDSLEPTIGHHRRPLWRDASPKGLPRHAIAIVALVSFGRAQDLLNDPGQTSIENPKIDNVHRDRHLFSMRTTSTQ